METALGSMAAANLPVIVLLIALLVIFIKSWHVIGPMEMGLRVKRFSIRKLGNENQVAFNGEAGYQADMLPQGWRFALWPWYRVEKHPVPQIPAREIGVVIAQVGKGRAVGTKTAIYKPEFGNFTDLRAFINNGGEQGPQRHVLSGGTIFPIHPVAFLVVTRERIYGVPIDPDLANKAKLTSHDFGINPNDLKVVTIKPESFELGDEPVDTIGIVTTLEGPALPASAIASRIGEFNDIKEQEDLTTVTDSALIQLVLDRKNESHDSYQNFQAFLDSGGKMGLQHDPITAGNYNLNPLCVSVKPVPLTVVNQGEVRIVKANVGLPTKDLSGSEFKFGSIVRPGHLGLWAHALGTGKYALNVVCYTTEIVQTSLLTLNWADMVSKAHDLDEELKPIDATTKDGLDWKIDLQAQIHIADTLAPRVIAMVGSMHNLVHEVLHPVIGNFFRNKLQSITGTDFIHNREKLQREAFEYIKGHLEGYFVETKGVYIQAVKMPTQLVAVLSQREIATQEIETIKAQKLAQDQRKALEAAKGQADMQEALVKSNIGVEISTNNALAKKAQADGEAEFISRTGAAKAAEVEAIGLAKAKGYEAQVNALGQESTTMVNVVEALSHGPRFVPDVQIGGSGGGSPFDLIGAAMMKFASNGSNVRQALPLPTPTDPDASASDQPS